MTNRDVVPASRASRLPATGVSAPPVPSTLTTVPSTEPHTERTRGLRASQRCRRRAGRWPTRSGRRPAQRTRAPGWRCSSSPGPSTTASTGPSQPRRTRSAAVIQLRRVTAGRKPLAIRPPRRGRRASASTSTTSDAGVALGHVDDLEAGDVDAELGGQGEDLCRGAGAVRDRDPHLGQLLGMRGMDRQVGPCLTGPLEAVVELGASVVADDLAESSSRSIRPSRADTMAGRFSAQMSSQISGWPLAMRVMSRNPPAARRSSAACSSARSAATPIRLAAARCGTWLTTATISSWRSGAKRDDLCAEQRDHRERPPTKVASAVDAVGREDPHRAVEHRPVGSVEPVELAAGHRVPADEARVVATAAPIAALTPPTSVTTPLVSASARFTWSVTASTGTATNVMAAAASTPPRSMHASLRRASSHRRDRVDCRRRSTCQASPSRRASADGAADQPEADDVAPAVRLDPRRPERTGARC